MIKNLLGLSIICLLITSASANQELSSSAKNMTDEGKQELSYENQKEKNQNNSTIKDIKLACKAEGKAGKDLVDCLKQKAK